MIDKLEFFIALARERHFGHAAESCGITQPTLSAAVKQLEGHLGVPLVNRGSRYLGLTPEGERVLEWARRIVADARAMRQDVSARRQGLNGHLRIAVIPTALAMVQTLTTPYRQRHPDVRFTILSRTSTEVLQQLENLQVDAGISYLDNEPLGRVRTHPLYREQYRLLISRESPLADLDSISWTRAGEIPLCLLTPDMQNRRIVDRLLAGGGTLPQPMLESNSMIVLSSHVRTGKWASVMPAVLVDTLGFPDEIKAIPLVEPDAVHDIGLLVPLRDPLPPLTAALVTEARRLLVV